MLFSAGGLYPGVSSGSSGIATGVGSDSAIMVLSQFLNKGNHVFLLSIDLPNACNSDSICAKLDATRQRLQLLASSGSRELRVRWNGIDYRDKPVNVGM